MPEHACYVHQQITKGLLDKYGEKRVIDTPITVSEGLEYALIIVLTFFRRNRVSQEWLLELLSLD